MLRSFWGHQCYKTTFQLLWGFCSFVSNSSALYFINVSKMSQVFPNKDIYTLIIYDIDKWKNEYCRFCDVISSLCA